MKYSFLQGVFARGDRRLKDVIIRFAKGETLSAVMRESPVNLHFYATRRERRENELFPWDFIGGTDGKEAPSPPARVRLPGVSAGGSPMSRFTPHSFVSPSCVASHRPAPLCAFEQADLERVKALNRCVELRLSGADLTGVNLAYADLTKADLVRRKACQACSSARPSSPGANLTGADLTGAKL